MKENKKDIFQNYPLELEPSLIVNNVKDLLLIGSGLLTVTVIASSIFQFHTNKIISKMAIFMKNKIAEYLEQRKQFNAHKKLYKSQKMILKNNMSLI